MNKMTKQAAQQLRADLNELLANHNLGFEFSVGNIRYSETEASIKLVAKVIGAKSETETLIELEANRLGLTLERVNGKQLVGYKPRNHKYPFIYELGGIRYKCSSTQAICNFKK